jgi:hypothetical protein
MRSRPDVKLLLSPGVVQPGERLRAEALFTSKSHETPVDFISMRLRGTTKIGVGSGKGRSIYEGVFFEREWRSKAMKMFKGEMRLAAAFDIPANMPQTYFGGDASIAYLITVYVSIPWWPDREEEFHIPVALPPAPAPDPIPRTFATSTVGPRGTDAFMEMSLDATQIAAGDVVTGSISLQNLRGRKIRGIDLSFVETEIVTVPRPDTREAKRFRLRVHDGSPAEGAAIPFRVRLPDKATPTFNTDGVLNNRAQQSFMQVRTHVELRAVVAWGEDVILRVPVLVATKASAPRQQLGWVAPVGRERQMIVWRAAAERMGLIADPNAQRMTAQSGVVTVEVTAEHREKDFFLIAQLGWPNMGLDLEVNERKWTDALAVNLMKSGDENVDERFAAHVREPAQAKAIVETLASVMDFEEVAITDQGAVLTIRGAPHVPEKLEPFCKAALRAAEAFDQALKRIAPPHLFAADVPAWEAMASRLRGRLDIGRMWIRDAVIGTTSVELGAVWERTGIHLGSAIRIKIDPPLETAFTILDDPRLSPAARDAWRELQSKSKNTSITEKEILIELEGKLTDPQTAMPLIDLALVLRKSLTGSIAAGPFR